MSKISKNCPRCLGKLVEFSELSMIRCLDCGHWEAITSKGEIEPTEAQLGLETSRVLGKIPLQS